MSKRKLTPLAQVLVLADSLDVEDTMTLADFLKGKLPLRPPNPKSAVVPGVGKRSPRSKSADESKANSGTGKEIATAVGASDNNLILPDNPDDFHKGEFAA